MNYGYARVSTAAQNTDRQVDALNAAGVETVFVDKRSGKNFERAQYLALLSVIAKGDVLFIKSIDRLGRNYREILEQWRVLTKVKEVDVVVLDMPLIDTRTEKNLLGTFIADLVLQILAFVAENERAYILERQREGIVAAKRRGVKFGRKPVKEPPNFGEIVRNLNGLTIKTAAARAGMNITTFRRHKERYDANNR
ncbi:MAG: recombinase family protein [Thermoguttaceae bacterium]|nr:recombinase family protein [Thermoguttaceae bacterium]